MDGVKIARMNERIVIEKSQAAVDSVGNHKNTWSQYFTCYAYPSTYEAEESGDEVKREERSVTFTVRWCTETAAVTSTGFRILFRDQYYNILSVDRMNYAKQTIKLRCCLYEG